MAKGNNVYHSDEELQNREDSRTFLRELFASYEENTDSVRLMHKRNNVTERFWVALDHVWPNLEMKERATVSIADKVIQMVSGSDDPVSDMDIFMAHRVSTADIKRYLAKEVEAPCVPMQLKQGRDMLFAIACDEAESAALVAKGYKQVTIRERGANKVKATGEGSE